MTRRGRLALAFGVAVYVVAWAFGSKALYPLGVGLVLAVLGTWVWMRLARRPIRLSQAAGRRDHYEGDDVSVAVEVELAPGLLPPGPAVLEERLSKLGQRLTRLHRSGSTLSAQYALERVPRGRYVLEEAKAVLEDPFGLSRVEVAVPHSGALLVYPRLVELERLFSDAGTAFPEGRRLLMHRPSGFDLHSVRDYQQGESLRRVHWRSTAKRARLMVKELEDAPGDEVAVLLDAQAKTPPGPVFDIQVRAAGSILLAHTNRNRRAVLVVNGASRESVETSASETDRRRALELLAAVEPDGTRSAESLLADEAGAVMHALELVVVTSVVTPGLVNRLVQRATARRHVSLVCVQAFVNREPGLVRLQAAGVPVTLVRAGDDLAAALEGRSLAEAASG